MGAPQKNIKTGLKRKTVTIQKKAFVKTLNPRWFRYAQRLRIYCFHYAFFCLLQFFSCVPFLCFFTASVLKTLPKCGASSKHKGGGSREYIKSSLVSLRSKASDFMLSLRRFLPSAVFSASRFYGFFTASVFKASPKCGGS